MRLSLSYLALATAAGAVAAGSSDASNELLPPLLRLDGGQPQPTKVILSMVPRLAIDSTMEVSTATATGASISLAPFVAPQSTQEPNMTQVQIGFSFKINYEFVGSHPDATTEIHDILPRGVAFGLSIDSDKVQMAALHGYDTIRTVGYITTVALLYIPVLSVSNLTMMIPSPGSLLYRNPNNTQHDFMSLIDPSFPVLANAGLNVISVRTETPTATPSKTGGTMVLMSSVATPTSTSSASPEAPSPASTSLQGGGLLGAVLGSVALGLVVIVLTVFGLRRWRRRRAEREWQNVEVPRDLSQEKKDTLESKSSIEMDAVEAQLKLETCGKHFAEKDGRVRSEAARTAPGPGFIAEFPVGGHDQGFIMEMPDTSRNSVRADLRGSASASRPTIPEAVEHQGLLRLLSFHQKN